MAKRSGLRSGVEWARVGSKVGCGCSTAMG